MVRTYRRMLKWIGWTYLATGSGMLAYGWWADIGLLFEVGFNVAMFSFILFFFGWLFGRVHPALIEAQLFEAEAKYRRDLFEMQMEGFELQERRMEETLAALKREHAEERQLLLEIREEREAELKKLGFIQGLQQGPALREYVNNPRARLRVLPPQASDDDRADKAS